MTVEAKHQPIDEIKGFYERGKTGEAKRLIAPLHPADIARLLDGLEKDEIVWVFRLLDKDVAAAVLLELDERLRELLVSSVSSGELVQLVREMETDDATDIVSELSPQEAKHVLEGINKEDAKEVKKLLTYAEDTAGGKMQAELVSVRLDATVRDAIEEVRRKSKEVGNISSVFVVDLEGKFAGTVALNQLILAEEGAPVSTITDTGAMKVTTDVDQEKVAKIFQRHDLLSMPVTDMENRLVGRITIDDVVDVIEEEILEDFYRIASLNTEERVMDPPRRSFSMRAPWLLINLGTAFMAAAVVKVFESTIDRLVILAVFMPIVAGMGGNAATQTIAVVVRGLALGELPPDSAKKLLVKEVLVGLANGVVTGIVAMAAAYILGANPLVGLLLFLAMTANLMIAGFSGTVIPLALRWWGADPALASSIFVTTCTDVGGFFSFLGLAAVFIRIGIL